MVFFPSFEVINISVHDMSDTSADNNIHADLSVHSVVYFVVYCILICCKEPR